MRKTLGTLVAVLSLTLISACGASGSDEDADTTTTEASSETTEATTETTEAEETTTTEEESSGDGVAVDEWAEGFCGNFSTWIEDIQTASSDVSSGLAPGDVEGGKAAIVGLFETASVTTEDLIGTLEEGGAPDIEDGEGLVEDLTGKFVDFNDAIEAAKGEAENLPTEPQAFSTEVSTLVSAFQDEVTEVSGSFAELDAKYPSRELQAALSESCTQF